MKHFALFYDFVPDFREKRVPHRAAHLAYLNAAVARGELHLAGAFAEDPPGSLLILKAEKPDTVDAFARADPYVVHGIATGFRVREWTTVVGPDALTKVSV